LLRRPDRQRYNKDEPADQNVTNSFCHNIDFLANPHLSGACFHDPRTPEADNSFGGISLVRDTVGPPVGGDEPVRAQRKAQAP
jgi:hypothetical protein